PTRGEDREGHRPRLLHDRRAGERLLLITWYLIVLRPTACSGASIARLGVRFCNPRHPLSLAVDVLVVEPPNVAVGVRENVFLIVNPAFCIAARPINVALGKPVAGVALWAMDFFAENPKACVGRSKDTRHATAGLL